MSSIKLSNVDFGNNAIHNYFNERIVQIDNRFNEDLPAHLKLTQDELTYKVTISLLSTNETELSSVSFDMPNEDIIIEATLSDDCKSIIFKRASGKEFICNIENLYNNLVTKIDTESTRAKNQENQILAQLESEVTQRKSSDEALQANINTVKTEAETNLSNTKSELKTDINNLDTKVVNLDTKLTNNKLDIFGNVPETEDPYSAIYNTAITQDTDSVIITFDKIALNNNKVLSNQSVTFEAATETTSGIMSTEDKKALIKATSELSNSVGYKLQIKSSNNTAANRTIKYDYDISLLNSKDEVLNTVSFDVNDSEIVSASLSLETKEIIFIKNDGSKISCDITALLDSIDTDIESAINKLNVTDITGFGTDKTLQSLAETAGKITATFQPIEISIDQVKTLRSELDTRTTSVQIQANGTSKVVNDITAKSAYIQYQSNNGLETAVCVTDSTKDGISGQLYAIDTTDFVDNVAQGVKLNLEKNKITYLKNKATTERSDLDEIVVKGDIVAASDVEIDTIFNISNN